MGLSAELSWGENPSAPQPSSWHALRLQLLLPAERPVCRAALWCQLPGSRGAQSEWPVSVSGRAFHTANHRVPWLCSKHRCCSGQCSPQCTAVPQNYGWRKVTTSASLKTETRLEIFTSDEGGTFMMNSNNRNYLKFGSLDFFPTKKNPMEPFSPFVANGNFVAQKTWELSSL